MMSLPYKQFAFQDYRFDEAEKKLTFIYCFDNKLELVETYKFDFEFVPFDSKILQRAIENLFFMAGISYYKMYVPQNILINKGVLDQHTATFFNKTYQKGLGEFWYKNKLSPNYSINFPVNATISQNHKIQSITKGLLVGIGGGKDSLVSIELLRNNIDSLTTWSLNHRTRLSPLIERIGLPHLWVERTLDSKIFELNQQGALNGHIPISAILACVGIVVAILSGNRDVVVSNEYSANESTLIYQGESINHQYSKTQEFEQDYQDLLLDHFGETYRYYSILRPFSELRIAEIFAKIAFDKYIDVFSSCNRAYTLNSNKISWCGECAKCAFTFLVLTPFVEREKLESLWAGKNLLLDPSLNSTFNKLLGIDTEKPLECVGEIRESRVAMTLAQQQYLELLQYHYDTPSNYNYRSMQPANMPPEIYKKLISLA